MYDCMREGIICAGWLHLCGLMETIHQYCAAFDTLGDQIHPSMAQRIPPTMHHAFKQPERDDVLREAKVEIPRKPGNRTLHFDLENLHQLPPRVLRLGPPDVLL